MRFVFAFRLNYDAFAVVLLNDVQFCRFVFSTFHLQCYLHPEAIFWWLLDFHSKRCAPRSFTMVGMDAKADKGRHVYTRIFSD